MEKPQKQILPLQQSKIATLDIASKRQHQHQQRHEGERSSQV